MVGPSSISVSLYQLAPFTCKGIGNVLYWTVQSHSLSDPSNQDREISISNNNASIGNLSSILTIKALPINDGISVGCTVVDQKFSIVSKGATLTISG